MLPTRSGQQLIRLAPRRLRNGYATRALVERGPLIPAPRAGDGPLMERRADRELPDPKAGFRWWRTFPIFAGLMILSAFAIFNYQKSSSPVISSTLYALRTNKKARDVLGDEIYFKQQIPWISGEMNQLQGRIDISFQVKGTRDSGVMRFASFRPSPRAVFETTEWSLELASSGRKIDLLDDGDPFKGITSSTMLRSDDDDDGEEEEESTVTRGFRQVPKR